VELGWTWGKKRKHLNLMWGNLQSCLPRLISVVQDDAWVSAAERLTRSFPLIPAAFWISSTGRLPSSSFPDHPDEIYCTAPAPSSEQEREGTARSGRAHAFSKLRCVWLETTGIVPSFALLPFRFLCCGRGAKRKWYPKEKKDHHGNRQACDRVSPRGTVSRILGN